MKIESLFWLSLIKKNRLITSLVVKINNAKMANLLVKEGLVLDHILYRCMRYNLVYKVKKCFKYYKYSYVLVYH